MTRFVYNTATTLNGYLADDVDSLAWLFEVPGGSEAEDDFSGFLDGIGAFVMGATTYEWVWTNDESENPGSWASTYGQLPCFVVTHRELPSPEGARLDFVEGPVIEWIDRVVGAAAGGTCGSSVAETSSDSSPTSIGSTKSESRWRRCCWLRGDRSSPAG